MAIFCHKCGTQAKTDKDIFCIKCGSRLPVNRPATTTKESRLKLLTDEWWGDQLVIFSILFAIIYYVFVVIHRGFVGEDIVYYIIFGIPIAIIVVNSFVNEKPCVSKKGGLHFLIFVIFWVPVYFTICNFLIVSKDRLR
jgi:DNA-directed RNA polymerase subunit RPC12/RpoP